MSNPTDEKALATVDQLLSIATIKNNDEYLAAAGLLQAGRKMADAIGESYDPIIAKAHAAHKEAISKRDEQLKPIRAGLEKLKRVIGIYRDEQERKMKEERARLEAETRRQEEEHRLAVALEVEAAGNQAEADAIMAEPVSVAPVFVQAPVPKVDGVVFREVWKFRITDPNLVPRQYMVPDEKRIGAVVRALKSQAKIAGVEVWSEKV